MSSLLPSLGSPPSVLCAKTSFGEAVPAGVGQGQGGPLCGGLTYTEPCLVVCLSGVSTNKATNAGVRVSTARFVRTRVPTCACMCSQECLCFSCWDCVCLDEGSVCLCACIWVSLHHSAAVNIAALIVKAVLHVPSSPHSVTLHRPQGDTQKSGARSPRGYPTFSSTPPAACVVCLDVHVPRYTRVSAPFPMMVPARAGGLAVMSTTTP